MNFVFLRNQKITRTQTNEIWSIDLSTQLAARAHTYDVSLCNVVLEIWQSDKYLREDPKGSQKTFLCVKNCVVWPESIILIFCMHEQSHSTFSSDLLCMKSGLIV